MKLHEILSEDSQNALTVFLAAARKDPVLKNYVEDGYDGNTVNVIIGPFKFSEKDEYSKCKSAVEALLNKMFKKTSTGWEHDGEELELSAGSDGIKNSIRVYINDDEENEEDNFEDIYGRPRD